MVDSFFIAKEATKETPQKQKDAITTLKEIPNISNKIQDPNAQTMPLSNEFSSSSHKERGGTCEKKEKYESFLTERKHF